MSMANPAQARIPRERPIPSAADSVVLTLPHLPQALIGRTVLHLSDFHIRRFRPFFRDLIEQCARLRPDFVFMTGDYMTFPGDEKNALHVMAELTEALQPKIQGGIVAVFGNHDYPLLRKLAPKMMPRVNWITNGAVVLPELNLTIIGTSTPCDLVKGISHARKLERNAEINPDHPDFQNNHYRILLAHEPTVLITAAQLGIEWCLGGHTHGGQMRIGPRLALHTSCDLPPKFASGILRLGDSICTVSRGLGGSYFDIRFFCPSQFLMYHLNRGPLPGDETPSDKMTCVRWW